MVGLASVHPLPSSIGSPRSLRLCSDPRSVDTETRKPNRQFNGRSFRSPFRLLCLRLCVLSVSAVNGPKAGAHFAREITLTCANCRCPSRPEW